ncbi:2-oxoacid dehydrogenases acyltransferase-domain-containing protein [Cunninghamella echinulata]|nr:2-oxoacid dehydrogenases acyltransferase-domain-containing protein [Cunninghamella echinulata]
MNVLRVTRRPLVNLITVLNRKPQSHVLYKNKQYVKLSYSKINHITHRHSFHTSIKQQAVKSFLLADIGEGITECELIQWFVEPGQTVAEFDKICEVQSDKASVEITSRFSGKITKLYHQPNDIARVGEPLVDIDADNDIDELSNGINNTSNNSTDVPTTSTDHIIQEELLQPSSSTTRSAFMTPSVRRLLVTNNININHIKGTGKNGLVLKGNVIQFMNNNPQASSSSAIPNQAPIATPTAPSVSSSSPSENVSVSLSLVQQEMFRSTTASLSIPQLGFKDEIELDETTKYRTSLNEHFAKHPTMYAFNKISYLPIFIKSLSIALSYYPILNSTLIGDPSNVNNLRILYRDYHHIGVAMDTPQGLLIPNIKNVQSKTIVEVASELQRLIELGKNNAIPSDDLQGGTITVSNIGKFSGTYSDPVVIASEMACLEIGKIKNLPRYDRAGNVISKQILPISWSADHRIIDGATIARFGNTWKTLVENPALLTSELR